MAIDESKKRYFGISSVTTQPIDFMLVRLQPRDLLFRLPNAPGTQLDVPETVSAVTTVATVPVPETMPAAATAATAELHVPTNSHLAGAQPAWHAPWENYRAIAAHSGRVGSLAFDPENRWFCTGSADSSIKIWETATAKPKLTLTGHTGQVRALAVSRHPYLFSAGDDGQVNQWDGERNKIIRSYHGHSNGVHCLALHPALDIFFTGGADAVCRVWDMRVRAQICVLAGHDKTVTSVFTKATDPQVVTGSLDGRVKLWDLATGRHTSTLIHSEPVRALAIHPSLPQFASVCGGSISTFTLPDGGFAHNILSHQSTMNCAAVSEDNVVVTGGECGRLRFWDWASGHGFQQTQTDAAIYATSFDASGNQLVTCSDRVVRVWRQDENATP